MEAGKSFDFKHSEEKWYAHWIESGYFHSTSDGREPYTIVIPPPNVTGILHMGHCLNNTIQDILARRERMLGKNVCWVPGTDHASIATEAKVVQMLRERGIQKSSLSRSEFLQYAWEWKEKYGGIILQQLKKLGCSLDWDRTSFTMDPYYYQSVIHVFIDLYKKGYIYRGKRMIHWDVKAKTALSDEEVIRKQTQQPLYHIGYALEDENGQPSTKAQIIIATVRPETIMGDAAICVHPKDERYQHLHGKYAFVPLINRKIPIITDEYVTMDFGTGALKVTPAHDTNDYQLGLKHQLEIIDILNEDGTLNETAQIAVGMDRLDARKYVAEQLKLKGYLIKTEEYTSEVGYSERTDAVVEPRLSLQWWVDMKKLAGPALEVVNNNEIQFYPSKFKNLYRHWMENIKDWCISRQLWWGHQIPAWYDESGNVYVAGSKEEALIELAKKQGIPIEEAAKITLRQDEDCLDTWFSSWIWPFEVFKGYSNPDNDEINYYYPTHTLVTAPEIIFFWVARMIMAGLEFKKEIPFRQVYFTGIVRDKQGRKMSKSLGNSPDLLQLIDQYGADACRFGIMISSPAGNDLLWDESSNEQGRNFTNKLWNAYKLLKMWESAGFSDEAESQENFAVEWMKNRLEQTKSEIEKQFAEFRLSEALKTTYSLIWNDFCSWYLEWIKPPFGTKISSIVYEETVDLFDNLLQLLHPFMPFITEELFHLLKVRKKGDDLTIRPLSPSTGIDEKILQKGAYLQEAITNIRDVRVKNQLKPKDLIHINVEASTLAYLQDIREILCKQVNATTLEVAGENISGNISLLVGKDKFFLLSEKEVDTGAQKEQLLKDLAYYEGFLTSVERKLENERFMNNAKPEVIELERKKKSDTEIKIQSIKESLAALS
ncbi:MAG: valine--tRNA ligase [Bacteroidetes bacterium]|nr:valine--tRNA ligase [Bacteroidota bacterium]